MLNAVKSSASKRSPCSPVNTVLARMGFFRAGDAQLAEPLQQPVLQPSACQIGAFLQKSQLNSAWQGRERAAPRPAASKYSTLGRLAAMGQLGHSFALSSHPSQQCFCPACSPLSWHHKAALRGSCLCGQPRAHWRLTQLFSITGCDPCWSLAAPFQLVLRPLSPVCHQPFSKSPVAPQAFITFFSFPDFISHNSAHGNTSKEALPHHTVLLSHPSISIAHSFPAITCTR